MTASPGHTLCVLLVSRFYLAARAHAERCRDAPRMRVCGWVLRSKCSELPRSLQSYHEHRRHVFEIFRPLVKYLSRTFQILTCRTRDIHTNAHSEHYEVRGLSLHMAAQLMWCIPLACWRSARHVRRPARQVAPAPVPRAVPVQDRMLSAACSGPRLAHVGRLHGAGWQ